MALVKIKDFDPNYREVFGGYDIKGLEVYSDLNNEKVGEVHDLLVDEQGHFRYFVVDLGFWGFGKKVLLPIDRSRVDSDGKHVHALGFTKEQIEELPEFSEKLRIDDGDRQVDPSHRQTEVPSAGAYDSRPVTSHEQIPLRQVPPVADPLSNQGYTTPVQQRGYQVYPQSEYPVSGQTTIPGQPPVPMSNDPNVQYGYSQASTAYGTPTRQPSVLQRFEERLRAKRMQSGS